MQNSTTTLQNKIEDLKNKCSAIYRDMCLLQSRLAKISMHGDISKFEESEKKKATYTCHIKKMLMNAIEKSMNWLNCTNLLNTRKIYHSKYNC